MSQNNGAGLFLSGVVVGAVVGAGIALLYAPRSGKDTRAYLSDRGRELKERAQRAFERGRQVVREQAEEPSQEQIPGKAI